DAICFALAPTMSAGGSPSAISEIRKVARSPASADVLAHSSRSSSSGQYSHIANTPFLSRSAHLRGWQVPASESALRVTVDICEALCWRPVLHERTNLLRGPRLADHLHAAVGPRKPISHETQVFSRARFGEFVHLHSPHVPSPDARGQLQFRCGAKHRPRLFHVLQELPFREPQEACASLHAPAHESVGVDTGAFAAVGGAEAMVGGARKYEARRNDPPRGAVADKRS